MYVVAWMIILYRGACIYHLSDTRNNTKLALVQNTSISMPEHLQYKAPTTIGSPPSVIKDAMSQLASDEDEENEENAMTS
jgi:hypothetical protein